MNNYYTYAYLREDGTPYYVGKGCGRRVYHKNHYTSIPPKDRILILKQNLSEEDAFKHEVYMIDVFGRQDKGNGVLRNRTDGGEGTSGTVLSDETKRKIGAANSGQKNGMYGKRGEDNPFYGKHHTDTYKQQKSEEVKEHWKKNPHPWIGRKHSPETIEKIRQSKLKKRNALS